MEKLANDRASGSPDLPDFGDHPTGFGDLPTGFGGQSPGSGDHPTGSGGQPPGSGGQPPAAAARLTPTGLTVRKAMEMPALAGARLMGGAKGLDRIILRANVMEVPDILPWVKPHELLLTTGYPLRNTPQGLSELVCDLNEHGLAAIGVKLHRYLEALPDQMVAEADRLDLPLLLLPDAIGFDEIINQVLTEVLNRQAGALERSWEVHQALLGIVLDGGGLDEIATQVSAALPASVFITTPDGRVLAEGGGPADLAGWRSSPCFEETGRFRVEYEQRGVHTHADVPGWHAVVPIVAGRMDHGRIVAFSAERELDDGDVQVLERGATVAALSVNKQLAVTAVESKYRGDFLRDVLAGRAGNREGVVAHCEMLGWEIDRPVLVVVAEVDPDADDLPESSFQLRPIQERFSTAWQTVVGRRDRRAPVVGFAREVVAVLAVPSSGDAESLVRDVVREVSGDGGGGRRSFSTGVSRVAKGPGELPSAYEQARRAVHVGRQVNGSGSVAHFDALRSFRLISLIRDTEELHGFVRETLRELSATDDEDMADLRHTLKVLLDANLNVAEAARTLHFHYNTLRYRISKLERMLGSFTTDPELRLDLALALKALQMRGMERP